jgi:hypothetical protein
VTEEVGKSERGIEKTEGGGRKSEVEGKEAVRDEVGKE